MYNAVEIDTRGQFHQHFTSSFYVHRYVNMCFFSSKVEVSQATCFIIYTRCVSWNKWGYSTYKG